MYGPSGLCFSIANILPLSNVYSYFFTFFYRHPLYDDAVCNVKEFPTWMVLKCEREFGVVFKVLIIRRSPCTQRTRYCYLSAGRDGLLA